MAEKSKKTKPRSEGLLMASTTGVRVRFAPSPTGSLHIGGLRTALYNYLFAKKNKGDFILRIEDTDRERLVEGGVENIISTLKRCGLEYDEGPNLKCQMSNVKCQIKEEGGFGPYIQSERLAIYKKYVEELLEKGAAYHCFCTAEELAREREEQKQAGLPTRYSGKCSGLIKSEVNRRIAEKMPYVVRLKVPEKGTTIFNDLVYGKIEVENKNIDHQVLLKSDGFPTYHLANIVDDHLMEISHVIRGEEWLPSTPKHVLLYQAFGWELPQFAHLPLLLNPDRSKLSKRQGDVAVEDYLAKGYLPEAILNFVALLGWNPKGDQEIYSLDELIKYFDFDGINKSGAILNQEKLYWINGEYIRQKSSRELADLCLPYFIEANLIKEEFGKILIVQTGEIVEKSFLESAVAMERERLKRLDEIPQLSAFLFTETLDYPAGDLVWKKSHAAAAKNNLKSLLEHLSSLDKKYYYKDKLEKNIKMWLEEKGIAAGDALWPMRVALSGLRASPAPFDIAEVLGKDKTIKRIKDAINKL